MDWEQVRTQAEIRGIRIRGHARFAVSIVGVALVLIGASNLLIAPLGQVPTVTVVRQLVADIGLITRPMYLADVVAIGVGAVLAWIA